MKLSMIFLALFSIGASASTDNTITVYDKSSRCELDSKSLILYSTLNGVDNNIQNLTANTKLSSFKAKNYCLLYDSGKNGASLVKAYNKGTAETFDFSSFWKAKESPNGKYLAVIETDSIQDGRSFIKSINILDKDGKFHINHKFENIYDSESFFFEFSHDNRYLNFFTIDEFSVEYTSVDLATKKVYDSLANHQEFSKLKQENNFLQDVTMAFFKPVSPSEFVGITGKGNLFYVNGDHIPWSTQLDDSLGMNEILGVGGTYIVMLNRTKGIELFRKRDGKKFYVVSKDKFNIDFSKVNLNDAHFIGKNKLLISTEDGATNSYQRFLLDLNKNKIKRVKMRSNCGYEMDCK